MDKEKRKHKKSKEEIAKEFDLPERKSKIATIMKQDGQVYCICRSSDGNRFMIGCDNCEEWYHGDCINITEKDARYIKQYYCMKCRQFDPTLQIVFRVFENDGPSAEKRKKHSSHKEGGSHSHASGSGQTSSGGGSTGGSGGGGQSSSASVSGNNGKQNGSGSGKKRRCGTCEPCRRPNCNKCTNCLQRGLHHRSRCVDRICINSSSYQQQQHKLQQQLKKEHQEQQERQSPSGVGIYGNTNGISNNGSINAGNITTSSTSSGSGRRKSKPVKERSRKRNRSMSPEVFINPELEGTRQCYGPSCINNSRPQSKYCSDACGIKLASSRIFHMLMPRLQERNLTPCHAAIENKKQLDEIRKKQSAIHVVLEELDRKQLELERIVAMAKNSTIDPSRVNEINDIEDEQSMYCITCGHEIHSRTAIKHMEKCFNKYESQASFGSIFKTRVEGNSMFCDFYNPASKTYCKRLRVLCPEHSKDPKISDTDVCGGPIMDDNFEPTGEICRAPKKSCFKHYTWEKLRRAEIDLERVRQWLKLDELIEQERQVRCQMSSRASLLSLMLHSTYDHEVLEELVKQQQQHIAEMEKNYQLNMQRQKLAALQTPPPPPPLESPQAAFSPNKSHASAAAANSSSHAVTNSKNALPLANPSGGQVAKTNSNGGQVATTNSHGEQVATTNSNVGQVATTNLNAGQVATTTSNAGQVAVAAVGNNFTPHVLVNSNAVKYGNNGGSAPVKLMVAINNSNDASNPLVTNAANPPQGNFNVATATVSGTRVGNPVIISGSRVVPFPIASTNVGAPRVPVAISSSAANNSTYSVYTTGVRFNSKHTDGSAAMPPGLPRFSTTPIRFSSSSKARFATTSGLPHINAVKMNASNATATSTANATNQPVSTNQMQPVYYKQLNANASAPKLKPQFVEENWDKDPSP